MTIVFVIPYFIPAWQYGGQPRAAYELARGLVGRGNRVIVLTTDSGGNGRLAGCGVGNSQRQMIDGIDVVYYRNISNTLAFKHRLFLPPAFFREIEGQMAEADLLHIHELRSSLTVSAVRAARKTRVPYIISTHGGLLHHGRRVLKTAYDVLWGNRIIFEAAALLAVSPTETNEMKAFGIPPQKVRQLPNTISANDYLQLPAAGEFRRKLKLENAQLLLFLGRLHWIKGADLLLDAFASFCKYNADAHLVIAGPDDGQESALRRQTQRLGLASKVIFAGYCDQRAKLEALVDANCLVVPSRKEVFSMTVIEALVCRCPVLLSDVCGLYPMPSESEGVRLFASENRRDLTDKIAKSIEDSTLRAAASQGRTFVLQEFTADTISSRAEAIYSEALFQTTA